MKKKKQQKDPNTMMNSTMKVESPMKQSLMVAAICLKAFWKLKNTRLENIYLTANIFKNRSKTVE